jgi:hypothetical protein
VILPRRSCAVKHLENPDHQGDGYQHQDDGDEVAHQKANNKPTLTRNRTSTRRTPVAQKLARP